MKSISKSMLLLAALLLLQACGATVYTDQNFVSYQTVHKRVAVLPFKVTIDLKNLPKKTDVAAVKASEEDEGLLFQQQLYTQFLNRYQKGEYTVSFLDVSETNVLLKRQGIDYNNIDDYTKSEIAGILGVDAVISGTIKRSKPMSTGAAIATTILIGYGSTNKVVVNMNLYDGGTGNLLWSYDHQLEGGVASSPDRIAKTLMKKSSKKFPYKAE